MIHNSLFNNILVTGATGFVGSHLVEELSKRKVNIIATTHYPITPRSYFTDRKLHDKAEVIQIDVSRFDKLNKIIKDHRIDCVFHLAAQPLVEEAFADPMTTLHTNILGTINVLESARRYRKIKAIIVASSDKAYGKTSKSKYLESNPLRGDHPYEVSKSSADLISQTYYKTYHLPVVVTRFGNIYGEGDLHFSRLIPGIMKALVNKEIFNIRSNGKFVRDYLYVKDVVRGYLMLADNIDKVKGEAFNFGSNDTYSVISLIRLISQICQIKLKYKILNTAKNEIPYQSLDWSKINKALNWKPEYTIKKTVEQIYQWYQQYFES